MRFVGWAYGSPTGTQYIAGSTITIQQDTVLYALWEEIAAADTENSNSKAESTKNDDGSITITVTHSDGTATQIIKRPDGTKQVVEVPAGNNNTAAGTDESKRLPQTGKQANAPLSNWNRLITALAPEWKFRWKGLPKAS